MEAVQERQQQTQPLCLCECFRPCFSMQTYNLAQMGFDTLSNNASYALNRNSKTETKVINRQRDMYCIHTGYKDDVLISIFDKNI